MFQVKNIIDSCPYQRQNLFHEIFVDRKFGAIHQVWSSPGHLFVALHKGKSLYTFDIKPATIRKDGFLEENLDLTSNLSPIVTVLFQAKCPNKAYIVYDNSLVQVWTFSTKDFTWSRESEFLLSKQDSVLTSAVIHCDQCAIYWSEKEPTEESVSTDEYHCYKICSRVVPREEVWTSETLESVNVMLSHCLKCNLYVVGESILIWLKEPCPPGVYLRWSSSSQSLDVIVHPLPPGGAPLVTERWFGKPLDFRDLVKPVMVQWASVRPISSWALVPQSSNQNMLTVDPGGAVRRFSGKCILEDVVTLSTTEESLRDGGSCFMCYFGICVAKHSIIGVYSLDTGQLLQELCLPDNELTIGFFTSSLAVPLTGVISDHGIYQIQLLPQSQWSSPGQEAPSILQKLQKPHHAALLALEESYHFYKKHSIRGDVPMELLLDSQVFQSPAILVTLLQEGQQSEHSKLKLKQKVRDLQQKSSTDPVKTKLVKDLEPLLNQFWELENLKNNCFTGQRIDEDATTSRSVLRAEVFSLLRPDCPLVVNARCSQLEILSQHCPDETLMAIKSYLQGDKSERAVDRWRNVLAVEHRDLINSPDGPRLPLYETMCRILFKLQPSQLFDFTQAAEKVRSLSANVSAFARRGHQLQLFKLALKCIPHPEKSTDVMEAAHVTAKLLMESHLPNCENDSMKVLLQWHLWKEAIQHVQQMENKEKRTVLFNQLVKAAVQENVMADYCNEILEICPSDCSPLDILKFLQGKGREIKKATAKMSTKGAEDTVSETKSIFCTDDTKDLPIRSLRPHLIGRMNPS